MKTPTNFTVINRGGYVDVYPNLDVALSAESLLVVIDRIKTELGFTEAITAGDGAADYMPTFAFGLRLCGAKAEVADKLRQMDLFPVLQPEELSVLEIRVVHEGVAYVDPRLVLKVSQYVKFAASLRARFGSNAGFGLKDGQFVYVSKSMRNNDDKRMVDFCQPLYRTLAKVYGGIWNDRTWIQIDGPTDLFELDMLDGLEGVLLEPQPILHRDHRFGRLAIAVDDKVVTLVDVKRFYRFAIGVSLKLGFHPMGDFAFHHEEGLRTVFTPPPLTSR
jgi:hypothetical protein